MTEPNIQSGENEERIIEIEIELLRPFKEHPFQVKDDPELLDLVDSKKLQFTVAVDISYIDKEVQEWIYEYISDTGFIKPKQIAALRNQLNDGPINQIQMLSIFNNCVMAKKISRSLTFSEKKLTKYFPDDYTAKDMEQVIESLLEKWMQEQSC